MRLWMFLTCVPMAHVSLAPVHAQETRTGADAFGTWEGDSPGVRRHIRSADLPPPSLTENDPEAPDFERLPKVVNAPEGATPDVPEGFAVQVFASGLNQPRIIRIAPSSDIARRTLAPEIRVIEGSLWVRQADTFVSNRLGEWRQRNRDQI